MHPQVKIRLKRLERRIARKRKVWKLGLIAYLFLLIVFSMLGDRGLILSWNLWNEVRRTEKNILFLEAEKQKLHMEIDSFRNHDRAVERYAREELELAGDHEIHYIFE